MGNQNEITVFRDKCHFFRQKIAITILRIFVFLVLHCKKKKKLAFAIEIL